MTEIFITDYFKGLATGNKIIAHTEAVPTFYRVRNRVDLEEFDTALRGMTRDVALLLELGGGQLGEWDAPMDGCKIGLHVLFKTDEIFANQSKARDDAKALLVKIFARMGYDALEAELRPDNQDGPLKAAHIIFDKAGNYDDMEADENWYGKSIYFNFHADISLEYSPNDWIS